MPRPAAPNIPHRPLVLALALMGCATLAPAAPEGGIVTAGQATIQGGGAYTRIDQSSARAIIDWRSFGIGSGERVQFVQPSASAATLNRVTGDQVSVLLGRLDANGQVFLVNPNGIVIGQGAHIDVGGLIASTANISDQNFLAGRLVFDEPGKPGAGIDNAGTITAADGGLVALVAPHVRNDGLIEARLGRVLLGAADTFALDLYGDGLISLAMAEAPSRQLLDAQGHPVKSLVTQAGEIDTPGGKTVLVTADAARNVLDSLINMSGTIRADAVVQEGGRVLLLGPGGSVEVGGTLSARGADAGQTGGTIEVLGGQVSLGAGSRVAADGTAGGGTVRIGGAWQGSGDTYRARTTTVAEGARIDAGATEAGNGGQVVVWSNGDTRFAGSIAARGGPAAGDGGRVEVSGKRTLDFLGSVDAGSTRGRAGTLLLDPAYLDIGAVGAAQINTTLRTGTSTTLQADQDIYLRAMIDGRGGAAGGGVTMTAGHNIELYHHIVTNNGAVNLTATGGTITVAPGYGIYTGSGAISLTSAGNLSLGTLVTTGSLSATSTAGNLSVDAPIFETTGNTTLAATAGSVDVNQTVANATSGANLTVAAGQDINIAAGAKIGPWDQVTGAAAGRTATAGGRITMTAGNDINVGADIASYKGALAGANDAAIQLTATGGTVNLTDGIKVMSDKGRIQVSADGNLNNGPYINTAYNLTHTDGGGTHLVNLAPTTGYFTTGDLSLTSTGGSITINQVIPRTTGTVTLNAADGIQLNQRVFTSGGNIAMTAGAGGITASNVHDPEPDGSKSTDFLGDIDARTGNISLEAAGDIRVATLRSSGTITVKSTAGSIVGGIVTRTILEEADLSYANHYADRINLAGYSGIDGFQGTAVSQFSAISANGSITGLTATSGQVQLVAANDILSSTITGGASLYAGRDITLTTGLLGFGNNITAKAGRNLSLGGTMQYVEYNNVGDSDYIPISAAGNSVNLAAGRDPFAGLGALTIAGVAAPSWSGSYGAAYGNVTLPNYLYVEGSGGLTIDAARDISLANVRVGGNRYGNPNDRHLATSLTADRDIGVARLDTVGTVAMTSLNGNITIGATLGAHVDGAVRDFWNIADIGVASLQLTANNGSISMHEARATADANASGFIAIAAPNGQVNLLGGLTGVESATGKSVTDSDGVVTTASIAAAPVTRLPVASASNMTPVSPGPNSAYTNPDAPVVPGAVAPGTPSFAAGETLPEIYVTPGPSQAPEPVVTDAGSRFNDGAIVAATGSQGTAPAHDQGGGSFSGGIDPALTLAELPQEVFAGGRGPAQEEDLGR